MEPYFINNIAYFPKEKKALYVILYKIPENDPEKQNIVKNLTKYVQSSEKGLNFLLKLVRI